MGKRLGRPVKSTADGRWARWRNFRERNTALEKPEPVHVLVENGIPVDKLVEAYNQANAGTPGTVETTLEGLLGHPVQGGDPPW